MKKPGNPVTISFQLLRKLFIIGVGLWFFYRYLFATSSNSSQKTVECDSDVLGPFHFYSQGSTKIDQNMYEEYFSNECNGVFVDVGANDGVTFSNSKFFEESLGWRGLCIEPHPDAFRKLSIERPKCININAGISTSRGKLEFLKVTGYSEMLSGFSSSMPPEHKSRIYDEVASNGGNVSSIQVDSLPLAELLNQYQITHIDFLSIDVEGGEVETLKTLDFQQLSVRYIVLEENTGEARKSIEEYMISVGFKRVGSIEFNGIYTR